MSILGWLLVLAVPALVLLPQLRRACGPVRGVQAGAGVLFGLGAFWLVLDRARQPVAGAAPDRSPAASVSADACFKCHEAHYASWRRTYHRTMTREATPEYVKGDFADALLPYRGTTTRLTREGDAYFMETVDPAWAARAAEAGRPLEEQGPAPARRFRVDRLVGSHWFQECLTRDESGRYVRLPVSYHLVEGRWVHTNGAFLAPDTDDFWSKSTAWNESCLFCHNTRPAKRPQHEGGRLVGYETETAELGISCEACHGPGGRHVRANQNPLRRFAVRDHGAADPTIVNPRRLSVERRDGVCAHCHGALVPRPEAWDRRSVADPYVAGDDLRQAYYHFRSEREQAALARGAAGEADVLARPGPADGRFWGDGTPLTTALEYNGMALSACYQGGRGSLSCLSCHTGHPDEPGFMLKPRMETNEACFQCHEGFRGRVAGHTHHPDGSAGSLCYNCHMPYQVYSLLTTHRTHRISVPRVADGVGTGKPGGCNLCHLDKSLGWTQERLAAWYGHEPVLLPAEDRELAASVVQLCRDDARSRVVVAGAFSWPPALEASGTAWQGPLLVRLLDHERFPAVRYLAHRGLRRVYGDQAVPYDYQAGAAERRRQAAALRPLLESHPRPETAAYPHLPLTPAGLPDDAALDRLLRRRNDPDVFINE